MQNVSDLKNKERVIEELLRFTRKVLAEPQICEQAKAIARKHMDAEHANQLIAEELSGTTSVRIPLEHSEADTLFLDLLKDVVRDETALY